MEEVEASLYDGDAVLISGVSVLLDAGETKSGLTDGKGWHAHASLPLSLVIEPVEELRLVLADGREACVEETEPSTVEGDRILHVFTGCGPLERAEPRPE